jgi:hypothetical protein
MRHGSALAAPLLLLLARLAAPQRMANVTVSGMQQCTQLEGATLHSSRKTIAWIDARATGMAGAGFDCEIAAASRVCWEGAFMRYMQDSGREEFAWIRDDDEAPFALARTEPVDYAALRGCASDCLLYAQCFEGERLLLTDPRLALCLDTGIFNLLDDAGCRGRALFRIATLQVAIAGLDARQQGAVADFSAVSERLAPVLADVLSWDVLDIRPPRSQPAPQGGDTVVISLAFMHALRGVVLVDPKTGVFLKQVPAFAVKRAVRQYVREVCAVGGGVAPAKPGVRLWLRSASADAGESVEPIAEDTTVLGTVVLLAGGGVIALPCILRARAHFCAA